MAASCRNRITFLLSVRLSNRMLSKLRLAPYAVFRSSFWVRDNVLEENVLELWTVSRHGGMVLAYVDAKYCKECDYFNVVPCAGAAASVRSGLVMIGSRSRLVDKQTAFGFNTGCFNSLRGCASVAELLPTTWQPHRRGLFNAHPPTSKPNLNVEPGKR